MVSKRHKVELEHCNYYINTFEELGWFAPTLPNNSVVCFNAKWSLVNIEFDVPAYKESRFR